MAKKRELAVWQPWREMANLQRTLGAGWLKNITELRMWI